MRTRGVLWAFGITAAAAGVLMSPVPPASAATAPNPKAADAALDRALNQFVTSSDGAPGVAVVVGRGATPQLHSAGTAIVGQTRPATLTDEMRVASVAKAFSGAVALSLVKDKSLSLTDTVGQRLPSLPKAWQKVTLAQLLNHTSGIPDFSQAASFQQALPEALLTPPPPSGLLTYVLDQPLEFKPASRYRYSNSDNVIIALMAEAATSRSYETLLQARVNQPFGLDATSLPRDAAIPSPFIHGYQPQPGQPPEDVSEIIAAGWSWASGGVLSTPADANRFIRAYVRGAETTSAAWASQFRFIDGGMSEPPGPGTNAAGLALFRYTTACGTVYGHTGNTPGYTQFLAATRDGSRSVTVSANTQLTPKSAAAPFGALRKIFGLAVCAALAGAR